MISRIRCNFWQSLQQSRTWGSEQPCTESIYTLPKVTSYPGYQNSVIRKNFTVPFLKYKRLKLKLRVFLAGHSVAMVTYRVTNNTNVFTSDWAVF